MRCTVYPSPSGDVSQGKEGYSKAFLIAVGALGWAAALYTWRLNLKVNTSQMSHQLISDTKIMREKDSYSEKNTFETYTCFAATPDTSTVFRSQSKTLPVTNTDLFVHLVLMVGFSWLNTDMS